MIMEYSFFFFSFCFLASFFSPFISVGNTFKKTKTFAGELSSSSSPDKTTVSEMSGV
jgi:hypothetical protein